VNPALYPKVGYDPLRDFAPVALVATTVYVLAVHPSLPVKKVSELITLAKARPRQLNYSSGGNGAAAHLAGELFRSMAGIQLIHLPYKGVAQALMAVLSGDAPITFASQPTALPLVRADKLRALGVTGAKRSPFSPDIPSIAEAALPGYETTAWFGIIAPAKTPAPVVAKLNAGMGRALDSAEVKAAMTRQSLEILPGRPEQFATLIRDELVKWRKVVKESGMRIDLLIGHTIALGWVVHLPSAEGHFSPRFRCLAQRVDETMQFHRGVKSGLADLPGANGMGELAIQLSDIVG
jgi:tripartite-type tricarboxylate transporter receptor subunit TctC